MLKNKSHIRELEKKLNIISSNKIITQPRCDNLEIDHFSEPVEEALTI